jgi:hypothetical protein
MTPPWFPDVHDDGIKPVISRRPRRVWRLVGLTRRHVSHLPQVNLFILSLTSRPLLRSRDPQAERTISRDAHIMQSLTIATCNMSPSMRANQVALFACTTSDMVNSHFR